MESEKEYKTVQAGPKLLKAIEIIKKKLHDVSYECVNISNKDACEILAKKAIDNDLI